MEEAGGGGGSRRRRRTHGGARGGRSAAAADALQERCPTRREVAWKHRTRGRRAAAVAHAATAARRRRRQRRRPHDQEFRQPGGVEVLLSARMICAETKCSSYRWRTLWSRCVPQTGTKGLFSLPCSLRAQNTLWYRFVARTGTKGIFLCAFSNNFVSRLISNQK
jgi:hypothetical protein